MIISSEINQNKRVLLVGSSFSAVPLFFALKKYGFHVSVCGNKKTDPCHQYSDKSYYIDYSKPEELTEIIKLEKFDFLVPSCNDYAYMSCASIASKFKFPGYDNFEVARSLHTKKEFREMTFALNIPSPNYVETFDENNLDSKFLNFPVMVKPIDSFSGIGISKINSSNFLRDAVKEAKKASRHGDIVVEEFVDGSLHSHSAWINSGDIDLDFFVDEFCTVYPYQVNCSNHPSRLPLKIKNSVRQSIIKISKKLKLVDGLIHTQFIVKDNKYWILETMRRCPGDLYGTLIQKSTSIDYADLIVRQYINKNISKEGISKKDYQPYGRHTISSDKPLVYSSFLSKISSKKVDILALKCSGEKLGIAPFDKLAIIFVKFANKTKMYSETENMAEYIDINQII